MREAALELEALGFEISIAPVDQKGFVDVAALEKLIKKETILVSVMAVNNEIGAIQPIEAISEVLANHPKIHFHVDAVQAIAKVPQEKWLTERVDFATFSAHKFHGPRGVGFIYWKEGRKLTPLLSGGGQEDKQWTENRYDGTDETSRMAKLAMKTSRSRALFSGTENCSQSILTWLGHHGQIYTSTTSAFHLALMKQDKPWRQLQEALASNPAVTLFSGTENFARF